MAFLTGSFAYGEPRVPMSDAAPISDVDIVILLTPAELHTVLSFCRYDKVDKSSNRDSSGRRNDASIMLNNLNLIIFTDEDEYNAWQMATEELKRQKPVTRAKAIETIERYKQDPLAALVQER